MGAIIETAAEEGYLLEVFGSAKATFGAMEDWLDGAHDTQPRGEHTRRTWKYPQLTFAVQTS
jgi:hypothetical protein